jgi:hypothetical protein
MIKLEFTDVYGFESAIRGMRNPLESWPKSDSRHEAIYIDGNFEGVEYIIGENDLSLMKKLIAAGSDHRKFMRMIMVWVDITAPFYWWKEFDTYKVGTVANSCSTMHKIHAKEFTLDDFSTEHLNEYNLNVLKQTIRNLNASRQDYNESKDKEEWWQMIQPLPMCYNQKRTVLLNYEVLRNMYHARENHKLDEWRTFCKWVETLPYSELITGKEK